MTMDAHTDVAALKSAKKVQKKAAKLAAKAAASADTAVAAPASASKDDRRLAKKQRKKEAKAVKANGSSDPPAAAAPQAEAVVEPPAKKSKKKHKVEEVDADGLPTGMAAVGDRTLAAMRPRLVKALYTESAEVAAMSDAQVAALREERATSVDACTIKPLTSFSQSGLSATELHAVRTFTSPSPIQAECLPIALSGRDLIGIAATGSGKTLAFGLPALRHIRAQREAGVASGRRPIALIVAPTRELALQISGVLEDAGSKCGVASVCIYGGVSKREQADALRRGVGIVVATPGRLEDLVSDKTCSLDDVSFLVLDEADRMLDMGFEPHIRKIVSATRADRQTLMFSATWPPVIHKLAAEFLSSPARVTVGSADLAATHSVTQVVEVVEAHVRDKRLMELLAKYHGSRTNRVLVFVLYKKEATRVESMLQRNGWSAAAVHGDISQVQRTAAVQGFKSGKVPLLVATDVAARGLDIPDVEAVINYAFPLTTEDYVHRIGRTGRAGKSGIAHTLFVGANDKGRAGELINVLVEANQTVPPELLAFGTTVKKKESKLYGAHFKDIDPGAKATKVTFDSDSE